MKNLYRVILAGFLFLSCADPVVHNHYYGDYIANGGTGATNVSGDQYQAGSTSVSGDQYQADSTHVSGDQYQPGSISGDQYQPGSSSYGDLINNSNPGTSVIIITTTDPENGTIDHYIGIGWVVYKDDADIIVKITRPDGTVAYQRPEDE